MVACRFHDRGVSGVCSDSLALVVSCRGVVCTTVLIIMLASCAWQLLDHQEPVVEFCTARQTSKTDQYPNGKGALVWLPPGGGKTYIMGALCLAVCMSTAVVAPAHLVDQLATDFIQLFQGELDVITGIPESELPHTTVLVCSFDDVKKQSFAALRPRRIIIDEVDSLSNGKNGYGWLLNACVRQGAACWGFTGTVIRNSWQDARRLLAYVTGGVVWEHADEAAVKAEAGKRNDWYYMGPLPSRLPHQLVFTLRAIKRPEEWKMFDTWGSSYQKLLKLGTSAAAAEEAAAEAAAAAPAPGSKRRWPQNLPTNLLGLFGLEAVDTSSSSAPLVYDAHAAEISSWLHDRLLPSMPGFAARAQTAAAKMSYDDAIANISGEFVPTLLFMVVTCVNIEHPDEPVVILCDTKKQVLRLQHSFERCTVSDKYTEAGRQIIKHCLTVGVNDLQKHVSVMHLLSPSFDPSRDYQAISRVHLLGQVADKVRIVSWVQLGMHENRYLHQVRKTRDYRVFQEDVRPLLGLPVFDETRDMAGAVEDTCVMPADGVATLEPLDNSGLQGGTGAPMNDADGDQSEDPEDGFYDMP